MRILIYALCLMIPLAIASNQPPAQSTFKPVDIDALLKELGITMAELQAMAGPNQDSSTSNQPSPTQDIKPQIKSQQQIQQLQSIMNINTPTKTSYLTTETPTTTYSQQNPPKTVQYQSMQTTTNNEIVGPGPKDKSLPPVLDLSNAVKTEQRSTLPLPDNQTPTGPDGAQPTYYSAPQTTDNIQQLPEGDNLNYIDMRSDMSQLVAPPYFQPLIPSLPQYRPEPLVKKFQNPLTSSNVITKKENINNIVASKIDDHLDFNNKKTPQVPLQQIKPEIRVQPVQPPPLPPVHQSKTYLNQQSQTVKQVKQNPPVILYSKPIPTPVSVKPTVVIQPTVVIKPTIERVEMKPKEQQHPIIDPRIVPVQPQKPSTSDAKIFTFPVEQVPWAIPVTPGHSLTIRPALKGVGNVPIYDLTASYKIFAKHFVLSTGDPYLPEIEKYMTTHYTNYLQNTEITAGFRRYFSNYLEYQILARANYGTFLIILDYFPETCDIQLKSLAIINFFIQDIDYTGCQLKD